MTPLELLEAVKDRFVILFHSDEPALERLLYQALTKYGDKAGALHTLTTAETTVCLPPFFWRVASCHDRAHRYMPTEPDRDTGELRIEAGSRNVAPFTVHYLVKLGDWPRNRDLPTGCVSLVSDYLETLIAIPNSAYARIASGATGISSDGLLSVQELHARLAELEQQMEDSKAILPPMAVY